ncbi:receptor-like protein EIX2 [Humulus lupulus]|uniref:receptor-like protein EIX2 n=1 Tax=Humulus lupulus TaxID=3486 RepID=UPI002B415F0E|nr:receptor-like protein EIX2 [Humulus lupulus]
MKVLYNMSPSLNCHHSKTHLQKNQNGNVRVDCKSMNGFIFQPIRLYMEKIHKHIGTTENLTEKTKLLRMEHNSSTASAKFHLVLTILTVLLSLESIQLSFSLANLDGDHDQGVAGCMEMERKALLDFKQGLEDPSDQLSSWVGEDCCKWRGVGCNNITGRVVQLNLHYKDSDDMDLQGDGEAVTVTDPLGGEINPSLLLLKDLSYLDLSMNDFGGVQIPNFFGSLEKLKYLNLSGANFGGAIPPSLGNLSRLSYLDLNNVNFQSNENELHWLSGLSSLKYLNLNGWNLTKADTYWVHGVNRIPSLLELHFSSCSLSSIPPTLPFVNFTSLSVLDLSNNPFNTAIPTWLFTLKSLTYVDLNSNYFQGIVPEAIANLTSLQTLHLNLNSLEGHLPRNLGKLCNLRTLMLSNNKFTGEITHFINDLSECSNKSLETLDLGYNLLTGYLPDSLGFLESLKYILLWGNSFQGLIPTSIGNLSRVEEIYLSNNQLSGNIPTSLGQLSTLVSLEIKGNNLEGVITEAHLGNLSSLSELTIYKDSPNVTLIFNISSDWTPPFQLTYIEMRSCQLGPEFPPWLKSQKELATVVLNNARISGVIPNWFWQLNLQLDKFDVAYNQLSGRVPNTLRFNNPCTVDLSSNLYQGSLPLWSSNITMLYLRDNQFSGPIPPSIGEVMPFLSDLDISRNSLNGSIPLSISKLTGLTTLVISNNKLSGEIPDFWNNISFLYIVDVSNNNLFGTLPSSMGFLNNIRFLILSKNNFSGELPSSLKNCSKMVNLDLSENNFSGKFPTWLEGKYMSTLLILSMRSNSFTGVIPPQLCSLSTLHILDLGHNNFSGHIPKCIGNLDGLKSELKESDITYQGKLQIVAKGRKLDYDSTLYLVNSFDISDNNLSGEIPMELTSLILLGTLNLSMNHLTGKIPFTIGDCERLETLDLSMNNLSGPIPETMSSLTYLNHLNLSYNSLSGNIPTKNQFQTLNDASIYEGNPGLCGDPLPRKCDHGNQQPEIDDEDGEDKDGRISDVIKKMGFFISVVLGFFVGFWGVFGTMLIKGFGRNSYFNCTDRVKKRFLVVV